MKDGNKTKEQLASELVELHQRIAQLETPASEYKRVEVLYALAQVTGQTVGVEEMLNDALAKVVQSTGADVARDADLPLRLCDYCGLGLQSMD